MHPELLPGPHQFFNRCCFPGLWTAGDWIRGWHSAVSLCNLSWLKAVVLNASSLCYDLLSGDESMSALEQVVERKGGAAIRCF